MKKLSGAAMLLFLFMSVSFSQGLYSKENLEKASPEELLLYLKKAQKLKKAGGVITIAGSAAVLTGGVLISLTREASGYAGIYTALGGLGATVIGLPIFLAGSSRVNKVSNIWNSHYNTAQIDLVPCTLHNPHTQHIHPGISLRMRF
jgi:hypothetical protein